MSLVTPDFGLLVWMTLIFGIVLFILARFGFPVITRSVEARAERIRTTLDDLKKAEDRMKVLAREQDELIARRLRIFTRKKSVWRLASIGFASLMI